MAPKKGRNSTFPKDFGFMNQAGSLMLLVILLLTFGLLIALPVLQLVIIEHLASIHEQVGLQTCYLAEAGLARAQQLMRFNLEAPLPVGEQPLGNGTYSVKRGEGQTLVAVGRVANAITSLSLEYEPWELSQGYLLCVGSVDEEGQFSLQGSARAHIDGNAFILGDLAFMDDAEEAVLHTTGELALTGALLGIGGTIEPEPVFKANPFDKQFWAWLQAQLLQPGEPLPTPVAGRLVLLPGVIYECAAADWEGLTVVGPNGTEAAATVIVRGDLRWQDCWGNINLVVAGDCSQTLDREAMVAVQGVIWVQGILDVCNVHVKGALLAGSLYLRAGPTIGGANLSLAGFPWQTRTSGLVVPKFGAWNYVFD